MIAQSGPFDTECVQQRDAHLGLKSEGKAIIVRDRHLFFERERCPRPDSGDRVEVSGERFTVRADGKAPVPG